MMSITSMLHGSVFSYSRMEMTTPLMALNFTNANYGAQDFRTMIIITGTLVYHYLEGWSYIDSLYFSVVTLTTIGYGDFAPKTDEGKLFTILYIVAGIGMILSFINTVQHHYTYMKHKERREILKNKGLTKKND